MEDKGKPEHTFYIELQKNPLNKPEKGLDKWAQALVRCHQGISLCYQVLTSLWKADPEREKQN